MTCHGLWLLRKVYQSYAHAQNANINNEPMCYYIIECASFNNLMICTQSNRSYVILSLHVAMCRLDFPVVCLRIVICQCCWCLYLNVIDKVSWCDTIIVSTHTLMYHVTLQFIYKLSPSQNNSISFHNFVKNCLEST